jgi:hypothetical protein
MPPRLNELTWSGLAIIGAALVFGLLGIVIALDIAWQLVTNLSALVATFVHYVAATLLWIIGFIVSAGFVAVAVLLICIILVACFSKLSEQIKETESNLKSFSLQQTVSATIDSVSLALIGGMLAIVAFMPTSDFMDHLTLYRLTAAVTMMIGVLKILVFAHLNWLTWVSWILSCALAIGLSIYAMIDLGGWQDGGLSWAGLTTGVMTRWHSLPIGQHVMLGPLLLLAILMLIFPPSQPIAFVMLIGRKVRNIIRH